VQYGLHAHDAHPVKDGYLSRVVRTLPEMPIMRGMPHTILTVPAAAVSLAMVPALAHAQTLDCMIQPHQIVQIGSPSPGVIEQMFVERGDRVRRGQVVAQLRAGVERAALAVAKERAQQEGEIVMTQSSQEFAQRELQRASDLHDRNFVSQGYLDKQRTELQVSRGRTDQASEKKRLASREVELAQAQLEQRTIRAPIDGVVAERMLSAGEYVDDKPIMRVASINPLRVDALVPAAAFGQVKAGAKASVTPELVRPVEHIAVVRIADGIIDAASNTFRVRMDLPNPRGELPPGLRCKVDLGLVLPEPAKPAAAAPARANADQPARTVATSPAPTRRP